jgi:formylglycine-generating enzyme required for sulfatase activity/dienelactone hydrolase
MIDQLNAALAGRYEIERELGHGGMATVYLAKDLRHSRVVAIKVLNRELALAIGSERFIREISIAAQLQHPHILTLIDSGEADGFLYYVMPYVKGESLRSKIARDGALPASEATRLFREIVDALAHAHKHGMVHRDIKPDNVMISDRHALVVDFGVAKAMGDAVGQHTLTTAGMSLGTPAYMAPEQVTAEADIDQRADIYAAGIVAYEMLAGKPPFTGNAQQVMSAHMVTPPTPLSKVEPSVPEALSRIVMKCLEKQRDARFQTADELLTELEALATPTGTFASGVASGKKTSATRIAAIVAVGVIIAAGATYAFTSSGRGKRWVRAEAIPQIQRYIDAGAYDSAYFIGKEVEKVAPGDTVLQRLWPQFTRRGVFATVPAGAKVYRATFNDTTHWELLGTTPTDSVRIPFNPAISRIRIEEPGYRRVDRLTVVPPTPPIVLDAVKSPNPEMIRVTGGDFPGAFPGLDAVKPITLSDFLIDRHEITNREYKQFVDAGGYSKPEYWTETFVKDGRRLSFAEVIALFTDKTGRPGPSTWEAGDFPTGQADVAVGGVSWYEAAAYAKFAGKSLPTIYHWSRAATLNLSAFIVPGSNFRGQGAAPGSNTSGMSGFGVFDMAGNVREWCMNEENGARYILGGGWSDATYQFNDAFAQPAFDRSVINGIRLVKYLKDEPNLRTAMTPVVRAHRDFSKERPVSDEKFRTFLTLYDYDAAPLQAKIEARDSSSAIMTSEKVTFAAAYGNERMTAYLYLPRHGKPPYQTVVYFPGSNAIYLRTSAGNLEINRIDFLVKSGRAVIYPIYKGTYERGDSLKSDYPSETIFYRDHVLMWAKDLRRSVDYLGTRPEIDTTKLAYFGVSWGGYLGGIMPAVEPRIKTVILYVAGLAMERARPEADPINFLPRVRQPIIMLNGKYDHFFPVETSQKPFFRLLGTPPDKKRYVLYEGGHFVPRTELIAQSLTWLDKYLGPVQ